MKNFKFPLFTIIILLFWFFPAAFSFFSDFSGQKPDFVIKNYEADITLDENGDMLVNESFVFYFENNEHHERWRDIKYNKYNPYSRTYQEKSNVATFNTESVSVDIYSQGNRLNPGTDYEIGYSFNDDLDLYYKPVECEPEDGAECESIYVYVKQGLVNTMRFDYSYEIEGAVTKYNDISELNWILYEKFEAEMEKAKVTIHIPDASKEEIFVWGHGTSGNIDIADNTVTLTMENIKQSDLIEFRMLMPADSFAVRSRNFIARDMENEIRTYQNLTQVFWTISFYGMYGIALLMLLIGFYVYKKYDKEYEPKFQGKYYRELPADYTPAEMSYLYYFGKINDEDVTATVLDLVRRKYLILDAGKSGINDSNPDFIIRLNTEKNHNDLLPHEKQLINWLIRIIGANDQVNLQMIENYPKVSYANATRFQAEAREFVRKAKEAGSKHGFIESSSERGKAYAFILVPIAYILFSFLSGRYFGFSALFPALVGIGVLIVFLLYVGTIKRRSVSGNEDFAKWKAFKEFLLDFSHMKDYPMPGIVVWEHYLVYATSLKVADKVMEQLSVKLPNIEEADTSGATYMHMGYGYHGFYFGYTLGRINRSMAAARMNGNATIAKYHAARIGSGVGGGFGGRGGGFGGGRSFGGGGGGGRIR